MKNLLKKIASLMMAMMMVLGMTVTTNAQGHTLTIDGGDNTLSGTFNAYKLFSITSVVNPDKTTYGYTPTEKWEAWLNGKAETQNAYDYVSKQMEAADKAQAFLASVKEEAGKDQQKKADATVTAGKNAKQVVFDSLDSGYYVIFNEAGEGIASTPIAVNVTGTTTAYAKMQTPSIEKTTDGSKEWAEAQIGTSVNFTVKVKVPNTTGMNMDSYQFAVKDEMSAGLTYNNDVTMKIGEDDLALDTDYTVSTDADSNTVTFNFMVNKNLGPNVKNKVGKTIVIKYSAKLNANAIDANYQTNTAKLVYTNAQGDVIGGDVQDITKVYTYQYTFNKTNGTSGLAGAQFKVFDNNGTELKFVQVKNEAGEYRIATDDEKNNAVAVLDTANSGILHIQGLKSGTYYIEETKAPDGYNKLKDRVEFVIKKDSEGKQTGTMAQEIVNNSGTLLPSTGGTGAMLIAVAGGLAIIFGLFVMTRKREQ